MDLTETPPTLPDGESFRLLEVAGERGEAREEMRAKQMQDARHGDENGDAFAADEVRHARGFEVFAEVNFGGEQGRCPKSHELTEDVTERHAVQEAQGMDPALVLEVLCHLVFDGLQADENVAMGDDDSLWLGGGAGGEDDLEGCLQVDGFADGEDWLGGELFV